MQTHGIRIFLYSSLAIVALAFVWGVRQIPSQAQAQAEIKREGLDHELTVVRGAVKASTDALMYRLFDILKSENHTLEDTPFSAATLLQWDQSEWKSLWFSSKSKTDLQSGELKTWLKDWPLAKIAPGDVYFAKVSDAQGSAYFALLTQVIKPGQQPMIGVGIFPALQFGLSLPAEDSREVRVFNDKGFALALGHPAYLGAALKHDPLVEEIETGDQMRILREWKNETGGTSLGAAARLGDSNLFVAVEETGQKTSGYLAYVYLIVTALGALMLNWVLFKSLLQPLFDQLTEVEEEGELLRRRFELRTAGEEQASTPPPVVPSALKIEQDAPPPFFQAKLAEHDFVEVHPEVVPPAPTPAPVEDIPAASPRADFAIVLQNGLRSFGARFKDQNVTVTKNGLAKIEVSVDSLQLQTAIEEILKNSLEAMHDSETREITISGTTENGRVRVDFTDTGSGILAENLSQVFDPFFTTKQGEGPARGLGLNVVRRVVDDLHGDVKVHSNGLGTTLTMEWPSDPTDVRVTAAPERHQINEEDIDSEDEFTFTPTARNWPEISIRKAKVRNLD